MKSLRVLDQLSGKITLRRSVDAGVGVAGARGEHLRALHVVRGVGPLAGVDPEVAVDLAAIVGWVSSGSSCSWEGNGMGRATVGWRWTTKESALISFWIIFIGRSRNRSSMGAKSSRKETEA